MVHSNWTYAHIWLLYIYLHEGLQITSWGFFALGFFLSFKPPEIEQSWFVYRFLVLCGLYILKAVSIFTLMDLRTETVRTHC